jgi:hypothetical protein
MQYPTLEISYNNDQEYQQCIRDLYLEFTQNKKLSISNNDLKFDDFFSSDLLDFIYDQTHNSKDFIHLYETSAAIMFSVDKNIGLAVLCSYTYFDIFHKLLICFFKSNKNHSIEDNEHFVTLLNMFQK